MDGGGARGQRTRAGRELDSFGRFGTVGLLQALGVLGHLWVEGLPQVDFRVDLGNRRERRGGLKALFRGWK